MPEPLRTGVNAYGGSVPTTITRAQLTTDIVLAGVFALVCLPFAVLGGWPDLVVLVVFATALAVRRRSPAWSLGIAWGAALAQMLMLRDLQLYDAAVLGVLYSTAAHGRPLVKWLGLASAGVGALVATGLPRGREAARRCGVRRPHRRHRHAHDVGDPLRRVDRGARARVDDRPAGAFGARHPRDQAS